MKEEFENLLNVSKSAFSNESSWRRARELALGELTCLGRHTITGLLTANGNQFLDWSSAYKIFSQQKINVSKLFNTALKTTINELDIRSNIVVSMDDTILKKTGKNIPGTAWRRDPLGPAFHTNFIWGQRFLQISMALPEHQGLSRSRAIPIDFHHCPTVKRPNKSADYETHKEYREEKKKQKLSTQGQLRLNKLRQDFDNQLLHDKNIIVGVDGSYTNKEVLKNLPDRMTLIGRIRKDTKLHNLPNAIEKVGRKRVYGTQLPTPEEIRQSDDYPWSSVKAWAAGKEHDFDVKVVKNVKWRSAGQKHNLQLVVVRPLGYRLTKSSKILYRNPGYLLCTDNNLEIKELLQAYLWRWEIEVNFREEKTLLGCGQAQIRNPNSIESVPSFIVAVYSFLLLASHLANKNNDGLLPRPLWYNKKENDRITTGDMINNFRYQLWNYNDENNFSGFDNQQKELQSLRNTKSIMNSAVFYCRN
jgi:hypothetical protein